MLKLLQITSGFVIDENNQVKKLKQNPKLNELEELIEELGEQQAIIWCNFKQEISDVSELLKEKACFLHGVINMDDRQQSILDFKNGTKQFLVANPASAGHGLTFVNCSTEIFYSLDFSFEKYEQARGRIHRIGQKNNCLYIHLIGEDTLDNHILDVVKKKKAMDESLKDFILNYKSN